MGVKDDVKQRRENRIRTIRERYGATKRSAVQAAAGEMEREKGGRTAAEAGGDAAPRWSAADPELAWKRNPNPWESWDDLGRLSARPRHAAGPGGGQPAGGGGWRGHVRQFLWKAAICAALFAAVWAMFRSEQPWAVKGQALVRQAMTDEIDFAAAAEWYKAAFAGAPSFIPIFGSADEGAKEAGAGMKGSAVSPLPGGSLVRTFAELLSGIELAGPKGAPVVAIQPGRVMMVTEEGDSVLIRHAGSRVAIYGKLGEAGVKVNDWVEAGDPIGKLQTAGEGEHGVLFFALKDGDRYIDPLDVIAID